MRNYQLLDEFKEQFLTEKRVRKELKVILNKGTL